MYFYKSKCIYFLGLTFTSTYHVLVLTGNLGGKVESICRCGKIKIWAADVPRLVTVCHCSVCRYDDSFTNIDGHKVASI